MLGRRLPFTLNPRNGRELHNPADYRDQFVDATGTRHIELPTRQLGERVQAHLQGLYGARSVVSCVAVPRVRPLFLLERRRKVLAERAEFLARQDHRGRCATTLSVIVRSLHGG